MFYNYLTIVQRHNPILLQKFNGMRLLIFCAFIFLVLKSVSGQTIDTLVYPEESHFKNMHQLTFGGDNAEAYWSYDDKHVIYQRTAPKENIVCDQLFMGVMPQNPNDAFVTKQLTVKGRVTCGFFMKSGAQVVFASTHLNSDNCPPIPDRSALNNRYVWPVYDSYDIFLADTNGVIKERLTNTPGYDAEATLSRDGKKMIFTSMRNGDLDLYIMDLETKKTLQVTNTLGYDGGAWFSADGKQIVWRASRPSTAEEVKDYIELLNKGLVAPTQMEVFVANADGSSVRQITHLGKRPTGHLILHPMEK